MFKLARAFCIAASCTLGMASFGHAGEDAPNSAAGVVDQQDKAVTYQAKSPACQQVKQLQSGKSAHKVYAESYQDAVYYTKADKIDELEASLSNNPQIKPEDLQLIRNNALLYAARVSPGKNIDFALKHGAELCVADERGHSLGEIILAKGDLSRFGIIETLHKEYQYDLKFLSRKPQLVFKMFMQAPLPESENDAVKALIFLKQAGIDISTLQEPETGINLLHIAAGTDSRKILEFIKDNSINFSPWDKTGMHVLDYAGHAETRKMIGQEFGYTKGTPPVATAEKKTAFDMYQTFFENMEEPVIKVSVESYSPSDFSMYGKITYDRKIIPDNNLNPRLIVAEDTPGDWSGGMHIKHTGRVAFGTSMSLGAQDLSGSVNLTVTEQDQQAYGENSLTTVLKFNRRDYLITSESTGFKLKDDVPAQYQEGKVFFTDLIGNADKRQNVSYTSAGNDGERPCITVDTISFCMQPYTTEKHSLQVVRVGAAHENSDGSIVVKDYSSMRPTFCSLLPYHDGELYDGTSFTSPAAAAIERQLADIFARSASFPAGVVHEDILMALMLTARTDNLIDGATGKTIPVTRNSAGIAQTDRCGAGIIQPQKAADLLTEMVRWTRENPDIKPTEAQTVHFNADNYSQSGDRYIYSFTVPREGILVSLRAGLPFEQQKKGAALLQIGDAEPIALDLSSSGLTTEFRLAGHQFKEGDIIKIITTKPLYESKDIAPLTKGFVDLRLVQPSSPIKQAIEQMKPKIS